MWARAQGGAGCSATLFPHNHTLAFGTRVSSLSFGPLHIVGEGATAPVYPLVHIIITTAHICGLPAKGERHRRSKAGPLPGPRECYTEELCGCRRGEVCIQESKRRACLRPGQAAGKRPGKGLKVSAAAHSLCPRGQPGLACECVEQIGGSVGEPAKEHKQVGRKGPGKQAQQ